MEIKKIVMAGLFSATMLTSVSHAVETNENFLADCGIGGAIFKNDTGGILSNIIWDFGLTATTSGLSSPQTCEGAEVAAAKFIHNTYANVAEDTARGSGEHIVAALNIFQCDTARHQNMIDSIRADFREVLTEADYSASSHLQKSQDLFNVVHSNASKKFASSCNYLNS